MKDPGWLGSPAAFPDPQDQKLRSWRNIMNLENRCVVARGEGERVGGTGNLGLVDANYCIRSG